MNSVGVRSGLLLGLLFGLAVCGGGGAGGDGGANGDGGAGPTSAPTSVPAPSALLSSLLNFAETAARNWNFGGHTVDYRFTAAYGLWDYTDTTYEPWLFDRPEVWRMMFEITAQPAVEDPGQQRPGLLRVAPERRSASS